MGGQICFNTSRNEELTFLKQLQQPSESLPHALLISASLNLLSYLLKSHTFCSPQFKRHLLCTHECLPEPSDSLSSAALLFGTPNSSSLLLALGWRLFGLGHTPRAVTILLVLCKAQVHRTPLIQLVSLCQHNILIDALLPGHSFRRR